MRRPLEGLDLNLLVVLQEILRQESVSRAAEALGTSQPAVSRALARLRRAFDDPLLVRSGRGMAPTPLGASLRAPLARALADLDRLRDSADFDPTTTRRRFRALVPDVVAVALVPQLVDALAREAPEASLGVLGSERGALVQLLAGDVDVAITAAPPDHPDLVTRVVARAVPWAVACGPRHPSWASGRMDAETWRRARHVQLIPGERPDTPSRLDQALAAHGEARAVPLQVAQLSTWVQTVRETPLVGTLPAPTLAALAAEGLRTFPHPLDGAVPPLTLHATWLARQQADAGHRWFRERLYAAVASGPLARR